MKGHKCQIFHGIIHLALILLITELVMGALVRFLDDRSDRGTVKRFIRACRQSLHVIL